MRTLTERYMLLNAPETGELYGSQGTGNTAMYPCHPGRHTTEGI